MPDIECQCADSGCVGCGCQCERCRIARGIAAGDMSVQCTRCSRELPESLFARRASGRLQSWCRTCHAEHARSRRATRPASVARPAASAASRAALTRKFGVEVEFTGISLSAAAAAVRAAGLQCQHENYNHQTRGHWKVITDASVSGGGELVSPPLSGAEGRRQVRLALRALRQAGASVNLSCGLHVHHDASDLTADDLVRLAEGWQAVQGMTDELVAPSRRNGCQWARRIDATALDTIRRLARDYGTRDRSAWLSLNRYYALNLNAYGVHGTVEVRQHQGTLNATKALAWIAYGQALIARAKSGATDLPGSLSDLLDSLEAGSGLDSETAAYLEDRAAAFRGGSAVA